MHSVPVVRLRRVRIDSPGWTRRRAGSGFSYLDVDRVTRIDDPVHLDRIVALAIPPAWQDVWISPWPNGHIQAAGLDDAQRRQYLYHEQWRRRRDRLKHEHVLDVARRLPAARRSVRRDLALPGFPRAKALALAFRLLDLAYFRAGGEGYAQKNGSYGLATLRREHVRVRGERTFFSYTAKGSIEREVELTDRPTATVVRHLLERPEGTGEELLAYQVEDGSWRDVTSSEINAYLKEISGAEITAKDFRTWNATVLMAAKLAEAPPPTSRTARKKIVTAAYKEVSEQLGNTPAVCKASYVDPRVVDHYEHGETVAHALEAAEEADADRDVQRVLEQAVCQLLSA